MARVELTKTIPMDNVLGTCLPNSLLRCILNSEKLSESIIEESTTLLGNVSPKNFYEKHHNDLFNHMQDNDNVIYTLLGMYCETYLSTHHTVDDIVNRIIYAAITSHVDEMEYKQFSIVGVNAGTYKAPDIRVFFKKCGLNILHKLPTVMRTDDVLINVSKYSIMLDNHVCTDMILSKHKVGDKSYQHVVYYNVLENIMEDNSVLYYVPYTDLTSSNHVKKVRRNLYDKTDLVEGINCVFDGYYYVPEMLHYQNMRGYKTKISEFISKEPTLINLRKRLGFLLEYINASKSKYANEFRTYKFTLTQMIDMYNKCTKRNFKTYLESVLHVEGYNYMENIVLANGTRLLTSKLIEQLYDSLV